MNHNEIDWDLLVEIFIWQNKALKYIRINKNNQMQGNLKNSSEFAADILLEAYINSCNHVCMNGKTLPISIKNIHILKINL